MNDTTTLAPVNGQAYRGNGTTNTDPNHTDPNHAGPNHVGPAYGGPYYGGPAYDRPAYDRPAYDRPAYDRPAYDRPAYDRPTPPPAPRPEPAGAYSVGIDQVRYWVGAMLTAAIAALLGVVGLVVAHGIIHVPVVVGSGDAVSSALYGLSVAAIALGAAGLFVGMLHVAPRPVAYYSWLTAMVTALAALLPFTTTAGLHSQIAFAAMNLAVGLSIMILVPMAAVNARR